MLLYFSVLLLIMAEIWYLNEKNTFVAFYLLKVICIRIFL